MSLVRDVRPGVYRLRSHGVRENERDSQIRKTIKMLHQISSGVLEKNKPIISPCHVNIYNAVIVQQI